MKIILKYHILQLEPRWYQSFLRFLHLSVLMLPYLFIFLFILFRKSVLRFLYNLIGWKHADRNESPGNFREKCNFKSQLNFAWGLRSGPSIFLNFDWVRPVLLHFNLTVDTWLLTFNGKNGKRPHIESCILIRGWLYLELGRTEIQNDQR